MATYREIAKDAFSLVDKVIKDERMLSTPLIIAIIRADAGRPGRPQVAGGWPVPHHDPFSDDHVRPHFGPLVKGHRPSSWPRGRQLPQQSAVI